MSRSAKFAGSTLTISLRESLTIDGRDYGAVQTYDVLSIVDVVRRIVTVTTTDRNIWNIGVAALAGTSVLADTMYMRFSNLDDTNHLVLTFRNIDDDEFAIKVDKGQSFFIIGDAVGGMANMTVSNQGALQFIDATVDTTSGAYTATCDASKLIKVGQGISGTGIAGATTVATVNTPGAVTSFTMSNVGASSETNTTATFTRDLDGLKAISAQSDSGDVDMEIYIAGK